MRQKAPARASDKESPSSGRVAIIVAIIGLVGTLGAALITVSGERGDRLAPASAATSPVTPVLSQAAADDTRCLEQFFADIDPAGRVALAVGVSQQDIYFPPEALTQPTPIGPIGLSLTMGLQTVGGLKFIFAPASQTFEILDIVDADCHKVDDAMNLTRSGSGRLLQNWDALGFDLLSGSVTIRFGLNGPDHFRLSSRAVGG